MKSRTSGSPQKIDRIRHILRNAALSLLLVLTGVTAVFAGSSDDILSPAERTWLTENKSRIVLAVETGYPPFVFLDADDQPTGLAHDYLLLLEKKLGFHFAQKRFSSLDEIFTSMRSGDVTVVNAVTKTPWRSGFIAFTNPFITLPNVIIVRKERRGEMREENLAGLKVSLVKSYAVTEQLTKKQLGFTADLVANDTAGLLNVSFGRSDAAVIDLATASYLIAQKGITNLRVAGETSTGIHLSFGVPRADPLLLGILNKGLTAISENERQEIRTHWINTSERGTFTERRFWLAMASVLFIIFSIFSGILFWNRTLRRLVVERTEALAHEKAFLRSLIDSANDLIYFKDNSGAYIICNKASEEFVGLSEREQIGKTDFDFFNAAMAEQIREHDQKVISSATIDHAEEWVTYPDGRKILLDTVKAPIYGSDGQPIGLVGISRDITERTRGEKERRQLEQQFHHAQKLESLGVLAGGIAHDFNNILTIILGHCYLAKDNLVPAKNYLASFEKIETAANRATQLCKQMLTYAGKSPLVQTRVNLTQLVDGVIKMLQSAINKNVVIELEHQARIPGMIGDAGQIQQIVMNLIINAAEAIGEVNGTIRVVLSHAVVAPDHADTDTFGTVALPGNYACLEVTDSGCGMDEETKKRIFEPFYTTKFTGRGLGMSAIQGIIKAHKGIMHLTSTPGIGTTFKVCFPVPEDAGNEAAALPAAPAAPLPVTVGGTVLLCEDEEMLRLMGEALLKVLGFSCMTAVNGREALEIYRTHGSEIDVILLDLIMPVMGGIEAYHELRTINPAVPIIICSGYDMDSVTEIIKNDVHAGFLHKPYKPEQLQALMGRMMAP